MSIEEKIYKFGTDNNILIGICDNKPLSHMEEILRKKYVPFTEKDIALRIDPLKTMPSCKSIIVIGINYNKRLKNPGFLPGGLRGNISITAAGLDYHITVMKKLKDLEEILPGSKALMFADTGALIDRELAKKAGLGWQGKNCSVISEKFGSLFFIGYMLTDLELKQKSSFPPDFSLCGGCDKCLLACPTNALSAEGFDYKKCISYLTQSKNDIDKSLQKKMGAQIYGCDICVSVCPHNEGTECEYIEDADALNPLLEDFFAMTDDEFRLRFKKTAAGWRGRKILQRNARIAFDNLAGEGMLCGIHGD